MRILFPSLLTSITAAFTVSSLAYAQPVTYTIDPAHTSVGFGVRHMGINNVKGEFKKVKGTITYDPANPLSIKINAEIDPASLDTGNVKRDGHVKSPDFLDTAKFKKITFVSKSATSSSGKNMQVSGDLTIHGITKPAVVDVSEIAGPGLSPLDKKNHIGASVATKIKRQDFGIVWNGGGATGLAGEAAIGDDIKIQIDVDAESGT